MVTLTCVPTGMNTGVSTSPWRKVMHPTRAFVVGHSAITLYVKGGSSIFLLIPHKPRKTNDIDAFDAELARSRLCVTFRFTVFDISIGICFATPSIANSVFSIYIQRWKKKTKCFGPFYVRFRINASCPMRFCMERMTANAEYFFVFLLPYAGVVAICVSLQCFHQTRKCHWLCRNEWIMTEYVKNWFYLPAVVAM